MALILSLETATNICSVALHEDLKLLSKAEIRQEKSHASKLAILIDEVMKSAAKKLNQISAVAVSAGPGSYTGLRIGTSTAKGICYALNIPLVAVNTLDLLAFQVVQSIDIANAFLCPMIDAKRMEVYCQVTDAPLKIIAPIEAKVIDENSFDELLASNKVFFFGNGAMKCKSILQHPNAQFLDDIFPQASALGLMSSKKFDTNEFENLVSFKPFYLKDFVAKKAQSVL